MKVSKDTFRKPLIKYKSMHIAAKAGLWFLLCNFIQKGIAALTTPIFTRLLTTAEYGRVNIFYSWADLLGIFITFGLSSAVYSRGLVKNENDRNKYTTSMIGLSLLTTVLSLAVFITIRLVFLSGFDLSIFSVFGIYAYVLFNTITEFWYQQKRVDHDYIPFVKLTLAVLILKPVLSIVAVLLFSNAKVAARILPDIIISGIVAVCLFVLMIRRGGKLYSLSVWKDSMLFVIPLIPHYLSQRVLSQSDRLMISNMIGDSEAGIYSLAYSVGMLLLLLNSAMDSTVAPWAYRRIKDRQFTSISQIFEKLLIEYGLCSICFSFFAPEVVHVFAPNAYQEAIYIIPVIALSSYFMFSYLQFVYFEYYSGKTQYVMIATLACAVLNLILNSIFIKLYGYVAAAYTTLLCYILYAAGHYLIMKYLCKKYYKTDNPFNIGRIALISLAVSGFTGICLLLYNMTVLRLATGIIILGITIGISIKMISTLSNVRQR